jgi:hypothetical protein
MRPKSLSSSTPGVSKSNTDGVLRAGSSVAEAAGSGEKVKGERDVASAVGAMTPRSHSTSIDVASASVSVPKNRPPAAGPLPMDGRRSPPVLDGEWALLLAWRT